MTMLLMVITPQQSSQPLAHPPNIPHLPNIPIHGTIHENILLIAVYILVATVDHHASWSNCLITSPAYRYLGTIYLSSLSLQVSRCLEVWVVGSKCSSRK